MSNGSNGGTCTTESALSLASGLHCLTPQQSVGLTVVALSGFVSLTAVLFIFTLIARNVIYSESSAAADAETPATERDSSAAVGSRRLIEEPMELSEISAAADAETPATENDSSAAVGEAPKAERSRRLINKPMDLFMLSLFFGSLFQALGVVLEFKWINDGKVRAGSFCTAQGVFQNLGQAAVSMQTTTITIHTFATIWWRRGVQELRTAWILVGIQWLFLAVFIAVSASVHHTPPFYYPTPYWCWVHSHYSDYRIAGESFWLWISFSVAVSLYTPLCFHSLGYISPDKNAQWSFKINTRKEAENVRKAGVPTTKLMLCAMAYCVPVAPTALARWFLLVHNDPKPFASVEALFSIKAIFATSGVADVVVFLLARPNNLLFGRPRRPIPAPVRIIACLTLWITLNVLDVYWICFYILSATDPVPRRKPNETREKWKAYYVLMYFYGFLLGLVNIAVWLRYIGTVRRRFTFTSSKLLEILGYFLRFLIIVLAVTMCLGPFFAPYIGLKVTQGTVWDRRCAQFPIEVILDGRPYYDSIKENPSFASFYFGQPGRRTEFYKYGMTQDGNDARLRLSHVTTPDPVYPLELTYRFANHSVAATCATNTSSSAVTIPCMEGSFNDGNTLNLTINDMRTGIVTKLRAFDEGVWAPVPADDAPSVLLREVRPDDSLGSIDVLRTAVTMQGNCTRLKLCLAREGIDVLAAVGLILKAQDDYAYTCMTPISS